MVYHFDGILFDESGTFLLYNSAIFHDMLF